MVISILFSALMLSALICCLYYRKQFQIQKEAGQQIKHKLDEALNQISNLSASNFSQHEMERISIVAQQTDNAIMVMDAEGNIEWLNDGFTRMYEYTFDEFIRMRGDNILKTSFNPAIRERLQRCLNTKQPVFYEAINVTPSGKQIWTHTSLTPILNANGDVIHLVTIDTDISKRKEAGDALIERVNALSQRINELVNQQQHLQNGTQQLLANIGQSHLRINETDRIVSFIRDMSDRIRIMGINASIEAHGVGAMGNGFRVISSEIVKMSDETKRHASQIVGVIDAIKKSSEMLIEKQSEFEKASTNYNRIITDLKHEVQLVEMVADRLN